MTTGIEVRPMKDKRKSFLLRMNADLWNDLNAWAEQEFRSVNGQIELVLRSAVDERKKKKRRQRGDEEKY
jgi:hypothetical protein